MSTVFVTLTDSSYFPKARRTLDELRTNGKWTGDTVLLAVDWTPDPIEGVEIRRISHVSTDRLFAQWAVHPLTPMDDNRHAGKVYQWDKLQVFDSFFRRWDRVVFLDAGLRVFGPVQPLLDLPWQGRILAPDDADPYDNGNRFASQVELAANPPVAAAFLRAYSPDCLSRRYFLNCLFVVDTALYDRLPDLWALMDAYPIFRCNEMGLMNLVFTIQLGVWTALPQRAGARYLFGWSEGNYRERPSWSAFHFIKYSTTHP